MGEIKACGDDMTSHTPSHANSTNWSPTRRALSATSGTVRVRVRVRVRARVRVRVRVRVS